MKTVLAKFAGAVTLSEVEQQTQSWYFAFRVIQVFLVTTFTSGATAVVSQIVSEPTQAVTLLSKNLPKASNFYISYFILYGLANASRYLFNVTGLLGVFVLSKFARTPRKKYRRYVSFTEPSWGSEYPKWTNLGVIALSYAVIAPLVLGFATIGLGLIYLAYRYNMLYVHDTHIDSKGGFYARALEQLMVGVYLGELCLLGLFGIGIGNTLVSIGPTVLQMALIVATIVFHMFMKKKLKHMNLLGDDRHLYEHNSDVEATRQEKDHPGYPNSNNDTHTRDTHRTKRHSSRSHPALVSKFNTTTIRNPGAAVLGLSSLSNSPPPHRSLLKQCFSPQTPSASQISASLIPSFRQQVQQYSEQDATEAYLHPVLAQREEVIWLVRDKAGVSRTQVTELEEWFGGLGVRVTDSDAVLSEKGKVVWDEGCVREAPLWEGRVRY